MPHCIIEYSKDLEEVIGSEQLMTAVYHGAFSSQLFASNDIKVRSLSFENYQCGTVKSSFVHVVTKILSGRTLEQRIELSQEIITELKAELKKLDCAATTLTVEIVEIEKSSYAKVLIT